MVHRIKGFQKRTIWFLGKECNYHSTYSDEELDEAQAMIDSFRAEGKRACVIHKGDEHHLYVEP